MAHVGQSGEHDESLHFIKIPLSLLHLTYLCKGIGCEKKGMVDKRVES